jgi:hypothetical protein
MERVEHLSDSQKDVIKSVLENITWDLPIAVEIDGDELLQLNC